MRYAYEDMDPSQFEELVVAICQVIFGVGVQCFSMGPDGGRDAKFVGKAECFPSSKKSWEGTVVIQAKHTNGSNKSCSETDFYKLKSKTTVLSKEIPRIKKLIQNDDLTHYILFTNRRLSGNKNEELIKVISEECGLPKESIYFIGLETLEFMLKKYPEAASRADLDPVDSPLIVSSDELAELVEAIVSNMDELVNEFDKPPTPRISYERKNKINNMDKDYAKNQRAKYLKETPVIKSFLEDPENLEYRRSYESITDEFQNKIVSKRKHYQGFEEIVEYIKDLLYKRDPVLRQRDNQRLTRVFLFYMYWNCDIGENEDVTAN